NALPTIGGVGGFVTVTQGAIPNNNVFTIVFGGTLAIGNLPPLISAPSVGVTAKVTTIQDGPEGTVVNSGATLQLQGNRNMTTENLTLNGLGFSNKGALEQVAGGSSTWALPVTLGSSASVGVDGGSDTVTLNRPVSDGGSGFGVTKFGPGTVDYTGAN